MSLQSADDGLSCDDNEVSQAELVAPVGVDCLQATKVEALGQAFVVVVVEVDATVGTTEGVFQSFLAKSEVHEVVTGESYKACGEWCLLMCWLGIMKSNDVSED